MLQIISKAGKRPDQPVINALTSLRESGEVAWSAIVDETRSLDDYTAYGSIQEGLLTELETVRLDPWVRDYPLILTESRSLAGVLRTLVWEYRARVCATNGQCGGFLYNRLGPALKEQYEDYQCTPRIAYLGDADFAGAHIENNTRKVLEKIVGVELDWTRLALTETQVNDPNDPDYDPAKPSLPVIQKLDKRDGLYHDSVETEALSQAVIVEIAKKWLDEILPDPLESIEEEEEEKRAPFERYLKLFPFKPEQQEAFLTYLEEVPFPVSAAQQKFLIGAIKWAVNTPLGKKFFG
jgi:hypothetical protein